MGLSRMLKINTPFIMIFLYVKLVGAHNGYLLELPDIKLPVGQNDPLENKVVTDQNVQLAKKSNAVFIYRNLAFCYPLIYNNHSKFKEVKQ